MELLSAYIPIDVTWLWQQAINYPTAHAGGLFADIQDSPPDGGARPRDGL